MFKSLIAATATLFLGLMIGCGGSKSSNGGNPTAPPSVVCDPGYIYEASTDTCVFSTTVNGSHLQLFSQLNISNNTTWAQFLDDYFYSIGYGYSVCGTKYWENILDFYVPAGVTDCSTYTRDRTITVRMNSLLVAADNTTVAEVVMTARSSWGYGVQTIRLPLDQQAMTVARANGDSEFRMQAGLAGRFGWKMIQFRGDTIDMVSSQGANIEVWYGTNAGELKKMGSAQLYLY